jgi:hypothetical protein
MNYHASEMRDNFLKAEALLEPDREDLKQNQALTHPGNPLRKACGELLLARQTCISEHLDAVYEPVT